MILQTVTYQKEELGEWKVGLCLEHSLGKTLIDIEGKSIGTVYDVRENGSDFLINLGPILRAIQSDTDKYLNKR